MDRLRSHSQFECAFKFHNNAWHLYFLLGNPSSEFDCTIWRSPGQVESRGGTTSAYTIPSSLLAPRTPNDLIEYHFTIFVIWFARKFPVSFWTGSPVFRRHFTEGVTPRAICIVSSSHWHRRKLTIQTEKNPKSAVDVNTAHAVSVRPLTGIKLWRNMAILHVVFSTPDESCYKLKNFLIKCAECPRNSKYQLYLCTLKAIL